ncbi:TspO/MBR family protein [Mucilaginibacter ginsenosidivorans]|uniref:Tryptophan-rich sensory protein n=1 Tax=Mucilaginibacter ginsenosidivorans TaxID=398053 RepID=A0A5B8V183_9SPHI|nr:TspO/MBR family protein [Mucilaginibacter ginsenosidivorans]QEC64948.1 tryptophan-rich sensory protein [Mucilaginibacter ginsenosidivorans]
METTHQKKIQYLPLAISIIITLFIGFAASFFTRPEISGWFVTLKKPSFNPPNWVFAPVWTTLYILIGISAYLVWKRRDDSGIFKVTAAVYVIQLILNFSWSLVFFRMHELLGALIVIKLLWLMILATIIYFGKFSKVASWLLVPYLLWVSFATVLNFSIYLLNR